MAYRDITIKDIEPIIPFSRGSTEIFLTGQWSAGKPAWVEKTSPCRQGCPIGNDIARAFAPASKGRIRRGPRHLPRGEPPARRLREGLLPPLRGRLQPEGDGRGNQHRGFERFLADHGPGGLAAPRGGRGRRRSPSSAAGPRACPPPTTSRASAST